MSRTWNRPSPLAWLLLVAGLLLFVSAGRWQYGRADLKYQQIAAFDAAIQAEPMPLSPGQRDAVVGYDRVLVRGELLDQRYLLDNQVRDGRVGIDVFAPLRRDDGGVMLVALGWLAYDGAQRRLPVLPGVDEGIGGNGADWAGVLAPPPSHGLRLGRDWHEQPGYPKLMPYFALDEIADDLGLALNARVLRVDPDRDSAVWRRDWRPAQGMPPERHLAYAWQWWSLAIAILVVFVVVHLVRRKPS